MDSYYHSNDESYVSEVHSQSESYFQEVGGDNGNFYGSSSHFQDSMINQMRFIAEENRELKRCIRTNNKELRSKMLELQAWKAELKNNGAKTTLNFKKTKTIVTSLREENALLSATNAKLELKLSDFMGSMDGDLAAAKLLKNFENLESRYKTVLATRNEKERLCVELSGQLDACRTEVERLKTSKERDLAQLKTYNNLLHKETDKWKREAELQKKLCQDKDQEIQDMKTQVVKLIGDNGDYKNQLQQAQDANKHLKRDAAQQAYLHQERVQKFTDDQLRMQKQLDDKQLTMDHLWKDYNKHKEDKEKIEAQHAKCANQQGMVDHYMAQMISAEESLSKKTADLKETEDRYRKELWSVEDRLKKELENVQFFKSQADVYKQDWVIEREEAAKIREQMENYKRMLHEKEQMLQRYTSQPDPSFVRHR